MSGRRERPVARANAAPAERSSGLQNLLPQLMSAALSALPRFLVCLLPATFFVVSWMFTFAAHH